MNVSLVQGHALEQELTNGYEDFEDWKMKLWDLTAVKIGHLLLSPKQAC